MITHLTAEQLRDIATGGGGLEIDGGAFTAEEIRDIATGGRKNGAMLIVHGAERFTSDELRDIATGNRGNVIFK